MFTHMRIISQRASCFELSRACCRVLDALTSMTTAAYACVHHVLVPLMGLQHGGDSSIPCCTLEAVFSKNGIFGINTSMRPNPSWPDHCC